MLTGSLTRTAPVAISAATIDRVAAELIEHGRVSRGYLSASVCKPSRCRRRTNCSNEPSAPIVMILSVEADGSAEKGGILLGDVLVEIGGRPVTDTDDVQTALRGAVGGNYRWLFSELASERNSRVTVGERRN